MMDGHASTTNGLMEGHVELDDNINFWASFSVSPHVVVEPEHSIHHHEQQIAQHMSLFAEQPLRREICSVEVTHELAPSPPSKVRCVRSQGEILVIAKNFSDTRNLLLNGQDPQNYPREIRYNDLGPDVSTILDELSELCSSHPAFEEDLTRCIDESRTSESFEACWGGLLERYDLSDNAYLHSLYSIRNKWVPMYLRDTFCVQISPLQRSQTFDKVIEKHFTSKTSLRLAVRQLEQALSSNWEKDAQADYITMFEKPFLRTAGSSISDEFGFEIRAKCEEPSAARYNDLCHEAVRCAKEGATSAEFYAIAKEGFQKTLADIVSAKQKRGEQTLQSFKIAQKKNLRRPGKTTPKKDFSSRALKRTTSPEETYYM
ncbi:hypothetical protein KSP39_PZI004360 [Platanthera zijinensis]|uniref:Protein FAR1-RELATED SEQUENCE n=1 Tax=Platanthera zijinensis TaxID=2320716 RepID=A0AAP0BXC1_9ASPA